jgi:hypothetical protein
MRKLVVVTFTVLGVGIMLVATIVADSAGMTLANADGYAVTVNRAVTPTSIIEQEHALFQR